MYAVYLTINMYKDSTIFKSLVDPNQIPALCIGVYLINLSKFSQVLKNKDNTWNQKKANLTFFSVKRLSFLLSGYWTPFAVLFAGQSKHEEFK